MASLLSGAAVPAAIDGAFQNLAEVSFDCLKILIWSISLVMMMYHEPIDISDRMIRVPRETKPASHTAVEAVWVFHFFFTAVLLLALLELPLLVLLPHPRWSGCWCRSGGRGWRVSESWGAYQGGGCGHGKQHSGQYSGQTGILKHASSKLIK
jgi:hypothetical protein